MWYIKLKVTNEQTRKTNKNSETDRQQYGVVNRGKGWGVVNGKGAQIYI